MKKYEELKSVIMEMEADITKFYDGTNSAGSRARKHLQTIKKLAQTIRMEIQEEKNNRKK